jgi:hypothetical protein
VTYTYAPPRPFAQRLLKPLVKLSLFAYGEQAASCVAFKWIEASSLQLLPVLLLCVCLLLIRRTCRTEYAVTAFNVDLATDVAQSDQF